MSSLKSFSNAKLGNQVAEAQKIHYLKGRGIVHSKPFQLDLIFPETLGCRGDLRHIPNDYARSSLFTARSKSEPRRVFLHKELFHFNEAVTIQYTGIELRAADDEIIWLQILSYGKAVALGEPFDFSIKDLVKDVNWPKNGRYYMKVRECISRLKASEVLALNKKSYGSSGSISLIQNYTAHNDSNGDATRYTVWIDPNLILLFAGNTFTSHSWEIYLKLSPVARRLADYIESNKNPYALLIETFKKMCDSKDSSLTSWRQTVNKAIKEVVNANIVDIASLENDKIYCVNTK
jgi:TrfA protein